jgi:hypothetical protein
VALQQAQDNFLAVITTLLVVVVEVLMLIQHEQLLQVV